MQQTRWIGAFSALLYVIGSLLVVATPGGGGDVLPADFEEYYVADDRSAMTLLGVALLTIGALGLLWFFYWLAALSTSGLSRFGFASVTAGLALQCAGAAILAGPAGVIVNSDAGFVGVPVAHAMSQAGFTVWLLVGSLFVGLGVGVLASLGRGERVFPGWVGVVGIVFALLQVASYIWLPSLLIPLWVLIVAVTARRVAGADPAI